MLGWLNLWEPRAHWDLLKAVTAFTPAFANLEPAEEGIFTDLDPREA